MGRKYKVSVQKYPRISVQVPEGYRERIYKRLEDCDLTISQYIRWLIKEDLEKRGYK